MLPHAKVIELIIEKTGKLKPEIDVLIEKKMQEFSGLISLDGAAHILANDLGVSIDTSIPLKVSELKANERSITVCVVIIRKFDPITFQKATGQGKVCSMIIADDTGETRLTFWNDDTHFAEMFTQGACYKLQNVSTKDNRGKVEITYSTRSKAQQIEKAPFTLKEQPTNYSTTKQATANNTAPSAPQINGIIVQVFRPTFYAIDKATRKKATTEFDPLIHDYNVVISALIDDGDRIIRTAFFSENAQHFCMCSKDELYFCRDDPSLFEKIRLKLLGCTAKVSGRISRNANFDREECIANTVQVLEE